MNSLFRLSLTVLLVAACSATDYGMTKESVEKFKQAQIECAKTANISEELIKKANTADIPSFRELGCYPLCFVQRFGIFAKEYLVDNINAKMAKEENDKFVPIVKECVSQGGKGDSICEKAYNGYRCYAKYVFQN